MKGENRILGIHSAGKENKKINFGYFIGPAIDFMSKFKRNGEGIEYYRNGNPKYVGDFLNGKYDGEGKYYFENGDYYVGEFKSGKKNGEGCIIYKYILKMIKGKFLDDKLIYEENPENKDSESYNNDSNNIKQDSDNNNKKDDTDQNDYSNDNDKYNKEYNKNDDTDKNVDSDINVDSDEDKKYNKKDNSDKNNRLDEKDDSIDNNDSDTNEDKKGNVYNTMNSKFSYLSSGLIRICNTCGHHINYHELLESGELKCNRCNYICHKPIQ